MPELTTIQQVAIWILPVLLAITVHEASHAWVASLCGDNTAKAQGRVSLNPMKHVDLFGTLIIPVIVLVLSQFNFAFGWAKPVQINAKYMRNPRRDMALTTAAGPLSNLIMAVLWSICFKLFLLLMPPTSLPALFFLLVARAGVIINLLLALFNLLPIPPLDGGHLILYLLPPKQALAFQKIEPYGFFILLALLLTGTLAWILNPILNAALALLL